MLIDTKAKTIRKKRLVTAVAGVLALGSVGALAQSEQEQKLEEVVVTGIRGSLINSVAVKQDSFNIVDAITAEDIGKFPDQNVAESLQRVTGVSIDRRGGEGQLITVRGMGPEFNTVLLNGRTLATVGDPSSMSWSGSPGGRAFSFDILASELISGADVYKTQSASLQEGSIGATVNIKTMRPMDAPGFKAVVSAKALHDDMTGKTKPQLAGLVSNTFADDTVGVLLSIASHQRESRYDEANTAYYFKSDADLDGQNYGQVYFPRNYDQIAQSEERERTSGTLVLQFAPNDDLTVTADILHSTYDVKGRQDIYPSWFTPGNVRNPVLDDNNTLVYADFVDVFVESMVRQSEAKSKLNAFGLNVEWQVNDKWKMTADLSTSKAESDPGKGWSDVVVGRPGTFSYDRSAGQQVPTMTFDPFQPGDVITAGWTSLQGTQLDDEVLEAKVDNKYAIEFGPLVEIQFGAHYSDRTLGKVYGETEGPLPWIYANNSSRIPLPDSLFSIYDADGFLSEASGNPVNQWPTFNSDAIMAYLATDAAINQLDDPGVARDVFSRAGFGMVPSPTAYEVNEELFALYADFTFEGTLGNMPWNVVAGMRYVETTSTSSGNQIALLDLQPSQSQPNRVIAIKSDDYVPVEVSNKYDDFLPSMNARINFTEELIGRLAYSKSLTRPELNEMSPLTNYGDGEIDGLTGSGSNPKLAPFESTNVDLTVEWYYNEGSYAAIAAFKKDVDGYLGEEVVPETVTVPSGTYNYDVTRPVNLDSTKIDGIEFAVQHMFTTLPSPFDGLGFIANFTKVDSSSSGDAPGEKLPLIGLGDSQNFILFYEKYGLQLRVAYNNRERFLQTKPVTSGSRQRDGHYVDDFKQIDISGSYDINDNLTVFFEGINVTNELYVKNAELAGQTLQVIETGPRYAVGVRAKF